TLFVSVLAGGGLIAVVALSMIMSIAIVVFAFMLLKWKKIGFWGIVGATVLNVILNSIYFFSVNSLLTSLISIIVLYAVLQIKKNNVKAWEHLK
ncbi:MAG: hypothetical protein GX879_11355, partial [Bacteroidales bacterium]|nr:hypothetical protein [Bacteroidales bacterium]